MSENIPVRRPGTRTVPLNPGISQVVVTEIVDMGKQPNRFNPNKPRHMVLARFTDADGKSAVRFYDPILAERSNLTKDLKAVNNGEVPKEFTALKLPYPQGLLGMQAQVLATVGTNKRGYAEANITAILPPAPGQNIVPKPLPPLPQQAGPAPVPQAVAPPQTVQPSPQPQGSFRASVEDDIPF